MTALHYAVIAKKLDVIRMLFTNFGSKININIKNHKGKTALEYAESIDIVKAL